MPIAIYVYHICCHAECFREVGSQAISYTTSVPAAIGGRLILSGIWSGKGVFNMKQNAPDPFMDALNRYGLALELCGTHPRTPPAL